MNTNKKFSGLKPAQGQIILSQNIQMPIDDPGTAENANILIVGGAGAGKLACYMDPNIMQADSSFIITDLSGTLMRQYGKFLENKGYKVRCLNLINMENSNRYNPFCYIHCDRDIEIFVETLLNNSVPTNGNEDDPSFAKAEKALLIALVAYLHYYECDKEQILSTIIKLLNVADADEKCPSVSKTFDLIFDDVEECDPEAFAVKQYKVARITAGRMWPSIIRSLLERLKVFNDQEVAELTNTDDIGLDSIGDEKTALFIIIPSGAKTYNFLAAVLYSQFFKTVSDKDAGYTMSATNNRGYDMQNRKEDHPLCIKVMLNGFADIGTIPEFTKFISSAYRHRISVSIFIKSHAQLRQLYKYEWPVITQNCGTVLYLGGGMDLAAASWLSDRLNGNVSDLRKMSHDECYVIRRGMPARKDKRYNATGYPNRKPNCFVAKYKKLSFITDCWNAQGRNSKHAKRYDM